MLPCATAAMRALRVVSALSNGFDSVSGGLLSVVACCPRASTQTMLRVSAKKVTITGVACGTGHRQFDRRFCVHRYMSKRTGQGEGITKWMMTSVHSAPSVAPFLCAHYRYCIAIVYIPFSVL